LNSEIPKSLAIILHFVGSQFLTAAVMRCVLRRKQNEDR
jgi:hypothetical protein